MASCLLQYGGDCENFLEQHLAASAASGPPSAAPAGLPGLPVERHAATTACTAAFDAAIRSGSRRSVDAEQEYCPPRALSPAAPGGGPSAAGALGRALPQQTRAGAAALSACDATDHGTLAGGDEGTAVRLASDSEGIGPINGEGGTGADGSSINAEGGGGSDA